MADITLQSVAKDSTLLAAAFAVAKREFNSENILFYCATGDPKTVYEKFVSRDAPTQVNLPAPISDPMHDLAKDNKWEDPSWKKLLDDAKESIARLWNGDCKKRFINSKEFLATPAGKIAAAAALKSKVADATSAVLATHKAADAAVKAQQAGTAQTQEKAGAPAPAPKKADPRKAAKRLGITDPESLALLTKANDLSFKGDKTGALKLLTELTKKEELKLKADIILKQLQEAGF
ncbi:MAG TPA: hypothetical protein VFE51_05015 [Verrucomicrobiae bacterium]|nr:hypothetical protein [Verrucomicrobiae bacterium]